MITQELSELSDSWQPIDKRALIIDCLSILGDGLLVVPLGCQDHAVIVECPTQRAT